MKGKVWIGIGLLLILAALLLTAHNLREGTRAQQAASSAVSGLELLIPEREEVSEAPTQPSSAEVEIPDYILNPEMDMPIRTLDGQDYIGLLEIPALDLELPVISEWDYDRLKLAPCRYTGSAYLDNLVICAHNYPSHFGNLQKLHPGDAILFTDVDGNRFRYTVEVLETIPSAGTEEMENGDWALTLFTCTLSGQDRITIRCSGGETAAGSTRTAVGG